MNHQRHLIIPLIITLNLIIPITPALQPQPEPPHNNQNQTTTTPPTMLIFLSPQYAYDPDIHLAINYYTTAIYHDLSWTAHLITLTSTTNTYTHIDHIIETYHTTHPLNACLMIGEDTHTALAGDTNNKEKPSTIPWATTGGPTAYETSNNSIISKSYTISICISLLYPTSTLSYETKKNQIITTLTKFSNQRTHNLTNNIHILESTDINTHSKPLYSHLPPSLDYTENPTTNILNNLYQEHYDFVLVHGHSNPMKTMINQDHNLWFTTEHAAQLHTPVFAADGCYTSGWWSQQPDNNLLDSSSNLPWYGSLILTSHHLHVLFLGLLSQTGYSYPVSFVENTLPQLLSGSTVAESVLGDITIGDSMTIYGDPTFHYTII